MIGSHNSLTYLKEKNLWMRLLRPWTKCQNKTLKEQYDSGIRYFDFRIKFCELCGGFEVVAAHNNVLYKGRFFDYLREIDKDDVYIRIILDYRKEPENSSQYKDRFNTVITRISDTFKLHLDEAITFWDWNEIIKTSFWITEDHYSVNAHKWYEWILGPKLYDKLIETDYGKKSIEDYNKDLKDVVLLKDFI